MKELGIITIKGCIQEFVDEVSAGGTIKHLWYQDPVTPNEMSAIPISNNPDESKKLSNEFNCIWKYEEMGENKITISPSILQHDIKKEDGTLFREGFHCGIPTYFELVTWEKLEVMVWGEKVDFYKGNEK